MRPATKKTAAAKPNGKESKSSAALTIPKTVKVDTVVDVTYRPEDNPGNSEVEFGTFEGIVTGLTKDAITIHFIYKSEDEMPPEELVVELATGKDSYDARIHSIQKSSLTKDQLTARLESEGEEGDDENLRYE